MEVRMSANHRTETQIEGDLAAFKQKLDVFDRSPTHYTDDQTLNKPFSMRQIFKKWAGTHGDHAKDQLAKNRMLRAKKYEQAVLERVETKLYALPDYQLNAIFSKLEDSLIESVGGRAIWDNLQPEVRQEHIEKGTEDVLSDLAVRLPADDNDDDLSAPFVWLWVGCQMHKDLNATKGGCKGMKRAWDRLGQEPVPLANRDNAAVIAVVVDGHVDPIAAAHANAYTVGGGEKLTALFGAFLNHKDDKKGQQDAFRHFALIEYGYIFTFPDTSNTRFGSNLEAAAELIERLPFYIKYIGHVRDAKEVPGLNNLEENAWTGIQDPATQTELAVMTIYYEVISIPYIATVRGRSLHETNALEMGPFHAKVIEHINKVIDNPDLVLAANAHPRDATLDGRDKWHRPLAISAIHRLASELPYLREILVAFFEGAKETWDRFLYEFREDGEIQKLSEEEKKKYWMPTTNDANEGALGSYRVFARRNPTGGLELFNALRKYKYNNTRDFMENVLTTNEDQAFLRKEARARLGAKLDKKKRKAITLQSIREVEAKRAIRYSRQARRNQRLERLASIPFVLDEQELKLKA